jgi:lauroyl/myristoyl acyltransferase
MKATAPRRRRGARFALLVIVIALAAVVLLPNAFAAGFGRLLADLWVSTMSAIAGLLGGVFGG